MRATWVGLGAVLLAACSEQGFDVNEHTDTWQQSPNNEVDILWVVDNSGSMAEEQDTLARGFSSFTGEMEASGTNFHIGVISTSFDYADPNRGVLIGDPPFLTNTDDYVNEFEYRAKTGTSGSDKEKGLEAAAWALSPTMTTGPNAGFLRQDAQLLIVIVSDEEDCSDEGALEGEPPEACYTQKEELVDETEYVEAFRDLKSAYDMVQFAGFIGVRQAACDDAFPSTRYANVAALTGGMISDICLSDWSDVLSELGLNATGVRNKFQLSHGAVPDSLVVVVNNDPNGGGEDITIKNDPVNGYTYDPETWFIEFARNVVPDRGAQITATFTVDPQAPDPTGGAR